MKPAQHPHLCVDSSDGVQVLLSEKHMSQMTCDSIRTACYCTVNISCCCKHDRAAHTVKPDPVRIQHILCLQGGFPAGSLRGDQDDGQPDFFSASAAIKSWQAGVAAKQVFWPATALLLSA